MIAFMNTLKYLLVGIFISSANLSIAQSINQRHLDSLGNNILSILRNEETDFAFLKAEVSHKKLKYGKPFFSSITLYHNQIDTIYIKSDTIFFESLPTTLVNKYTIDGFEIKNWKVNGMSFYFPIRTGHIRPLSNNWQLYVGDVCCMPSRQNIESLNKSLHAYQSRCILNYNESQLEVFRSALDEALKQGRTTIITEGQRRLIVQANAANEKKDYNGALQLYEEVAEIDHYSYPTAYYNMALIAAQLGKYEEAIHYMKKYILLEPNAPDLRASKDKIYEWEYEINLRIR